MVASLPNFPRRVSVGDSFALFGPTHVLAVLNVDTAGADAVAAWVDAQDVCTVAQTAPLPDGRTAVLLRRHHVKQPYAEALDEWLRHAGV